MNPVNANVADAVRGFSMCNEAIHISRLNIAYRLTKQALKEANVPESGYVKVWRINPNVFNGGYTEYSFCEADDAGERDDAGLQKLMFIDIANNPRHYQGLINGKILACDKVEKVVNAVPADTLLQRVIDECRGYYEVQRHAVNLMNVIMRDIDYVDRKAVKHAPRKKTELQKLYRERFSRWKVIKWIWREYRAFSA